MSGSIWERLGILVHRSDAHHSVEPSSTCPVIRLNGGRASVSRENRVCFKCGDTQFLSGVIVFQKDSVRGVLCPSCLNHL